MPAESVISRSNSTATHADQFGCSALCSAPLAPSQAHKSRVLDQVVAIVDDDIVLASELEERVLGIKSSLEARGVDVPPTTS